jgi:hypothetical protein
MHNTVYLLVLLLVGLSFQFSQRAHFNDFRSGAQVQNIPFPFTTLPGAPMYIEVYAIGDLNGGDEYIILNVEGSSWVWLNNNINDDPFETELDISSCHPQSPFCGNYVSGPTADVGYSDGTNIGIYAVPPAVASAWLADGSLCEPCLEFGS